MANNSRTIAYILIAVFAACILFPLLFVKTGSGEVSESEQRILADFPDLYSRESGFNMQWWPQLCSWAGDHIGFRDLAVKTVNEIQTAVMHRPGTDRVHIGENGWLYYTGDGNLELAVNGGYVDPDILKGSAIRLTQIRDKLAEEGAEFVLVLVPSKVSIYPEYLRYGDGKTGRTACDTLTGYLLENTDINVINLKDILLEEKKNGTVYFATDTHWNFKGSYCAYRDIVDALNGFGACNAKPAEVTFSEGKFQGGLANMINDPRIEDCEIPVIGESNPEELSVLIIGDSFFDGWMIPELFDATFSDVSFCPHKDITESIISEAEPDLVIYEVTERFQGEITSLADDYVAD